jgi:hypothetical protein
MLFYAGAGRQVKDFFKSTNSLRENLITILWGLLCPWREAVSYELRASSPYNS